MAKRGSASTGRFRRTRWSGVYERNGLYYPRLYVGKFDGRSKYEWLDPQPRGELAADELARVRAGRSQSSKRGRLHTVVSWGKKTEDHPLGLWLSLRPRAKEGTNRGYAEQVKPFVAEYGDMLLRDVDVELALEWLEVRKMRWTVGGLRAMFSDARRAGLIERNPFVGLGLSTGPGRKNIEVLKLGQVFDLAEIAAATWGSDGYGLVWRALVLWQAFVGTRPAEAYGVVRADLDVAEAEVDVRRQRTPFTPRDATPDELPLPKNGKTRRIVIPPPALDAIQALPRPIDPDAPLFGTRRGRPLSGQVQHYYWQPIRCAFGNPSLDLYELRHFCASYMLNDLDLHAEDVAAQLGHTDGGVLVQRLYGHPSTELARKRAHEAHRRSIVRPLRSAEELGEG
jgi:integrase